jgi:hypothetical protein
LRKQARPNPFGHGSAPATFPQLSSFAESCVRRGTPGGTNYNGREKNSFRHDAVEEQRNPIDP